MTKITNNGKRRLGLSGRPSLIIDAGQSVEVSNAQYKSFIESGIVARWFASGLLTVDGEVEIGIGHQVVGTDLWSKQVPAESTESEVDQHSVALPEGIKSEGVELYHAGGGWWEVYVNGFLVTNVKVRKAEAEKIAEDYR